MLTWGIRISMWSLKRKIKYDCKWSYKQQVSSQTGPRPLSPWSPGKVWGEGCEDGDLSNFVVHGLWIPSGQGLLRLSNVLRSTLFWKPERGGCLHTLSPQLRIVYQPLPGDPVTRFQASWRETEKQGCEQQVSSVISLKAAPRLYNRHLFPSKTHRSSCLPPPWPASGLTWCSHLG